MPFALRICRALSLVNLVEQRIDQRLTQELFHRFRIAQHQETPRGRRGHGIPSATPGHRARAENQIADPLTPERTGREVEAVQLGRAVALYRRLAQQIAAPYGRALVAEGVKRLANAPALVVRHGQAGEDEENVEGFAEALLHEVHHDHDAENKKRANGQADGDNPAAREGDLLPGRAGPYQALAALQVGLNDLPLFFGERTLCQHLLGGENGACRRVFAVTLRGGVEVVVGVVRLRFVDGHRLLAFGALDVLAQ